MIDLNINLNLKHLGDAQMHEIRAYFKHLKDLITMNQADLAQSLTDLKAQADKTKAEIVGKIATLEAAVTAGGMTTPEVDAALADLKGAVQGLDDLNPDAVAP